MNDIVERLREALSAAQAALTEYGDEMVDARAEMGWLRKHNADLAAEIKRLRAALREIANRPVSVREPSTETQFIWVQEQARRALEDKP